MIKLKKGFILSLLLSAILVPAVASAGVYFMEKEESNYERPSTIRPCEARGFTIIPKKHCGATQIGSGELDSSKQCQNPVGVGTNELLHRYCTCNPETYKYERCTDAGNEWRTGQELIGKSCKNELGIEKHSQCGCNDSKYPYMVDSSNCPADSQADGSKQITKTVLGLPCNNKQDQVAVDDFRYPACACSPDYKKTCGVPFIGEGYSCDGRYKDCLCDKDVYNKRCEADGSKPQYRCEDKNGVFYSKCNSDLPQVRVYIYDASVSNNGKGDCNKPAGENPLGDVKVTFTRQGEAEVVTNTLSNGEVSIAVPFEGMEIPKGQPGHVPVTIKIEKLRNDKYDGTDQEEKDYISFTDDCPCDGKTYGLVPKKFGENNVVIVTSWGSYKWFKERDRNPEANKYNIRDLDVHTLKMNSAGDVEDRIYYPEAERNKGGMSLDVDNQYCYGAETVRIPTSDVLGGSKYYFSTLRFSEGVPISSNTESRTEKNPGDVLSKGMVRVYVFLDGELKRIFKSENATTKAITDPSKAPTVWNVFRLENSGGQVKITGTGNPQHGKITEAIGTSSTGTYRLIGSDTADGMTPQKAHGY